MSKEVDFAVFGQLCDVGTKTCSGVVYPVISSSGREPHHHIEPQICGSLAQSFLGRAASGSP
jgi:hypothetical protein